MPKRIALRKLRWVAAFTCFVIGIVVALLLLPHPDDSDPGKAAVRNWLRENLPVPKWEEIRWQGPAADGNESFVRLKYRHANRVGGTTVSDDIFRIKNGHARPVDTDGHNGRVFWQQAEDNVVLELWHDRDEAVAIIRNREADREFRELERRANSGDRAARQKFRKQLGLDP